MKPKYPTTLGEQVRYYYSRFMEKDYILRVFMNGKIYFDGSLDLFFHFGSEGYAQVADFFRDDEHKLVTIYTTSN